ncbi:MAG: F0F1 ATP synthase subunit delta [Boseongicola sp.]
MSESSSISTGIASRYATAVFELAKDGDELSSLERDIDTIEAALNDSADFRALINSPIYTRTAQGNAIAAIADKMELSGTVANTLKLMASNRRLFVLPHLVTALRQLIADEKGEVTADVRAARSLSDEQAAKLAETLKASVGKDVKMNVTVDENLIGGLIVKVGSKMIDTSIRSKLAALQNTMKEVG